MKFPEYMWRDLRAAAEAGDFEGFAAEVSEFLAVMRHRANGLPPQEAARPLAGCALTGVWYHEEAVGDGRFMRSGRLDQDHPVGGAHSAVVRVFPGGHYTIDLALTCVAAGLGDQDAALAKARELGAEVPESTDWTPWPPGSR